MGNAVETFVSEWSTVDGTAANGGQGLVLSRDSQILGELEDSDVARHRSWGDVIQDRLFGEEGDHRLQLGLVPQPFIGNLRDAKVVILLLNPGLALGDFHAEFEYPDYRKALLKNLRGDLWSTDHPFLFLDPQWAWTSGYAWWSSRLRHVIGRLAKDHPTRASAQAEVARSVAAIELIPYHSKCKPVELPELHSRRLAVSLARALHTSGKSIVVARGHTAWGFVDDEHDVFLCPKSRGVSFPVKESGETKDSAGDFILDAIQGSDHKSASDQTLRKRFLTDLGEPLLLDDASKA